MTLPALSAESIAILQHMRRAANASPITPTIADRRAALHDMAAHYGPPHAQVERIENRFIDGPHGIVRVTTYHPATQRDGAPIMVQFHGGGWALGGPSTYERQSRAICAACETVLVDVDYRLAPEHKFPAALDDCEIAARWSLDFAQSLGLAHDKLFVLGDSAGGYLAALFCQRHPEIVAGQILIYPVLTVGRTNDRAARKMLGTGEYFLTFDAITNAEAEFFADSGEDGAVGISPLLADSQVLASLPPTLMILASFDPLIDEGKEYVLRLQKAGVQVEQMVEEGTIHGFLLFSGAISAGAKYFDEITRFVHISTT